jgi:hypothetical protein
MYQLDALPATTALEIAAAYSIARFTGIADPNALAIAINTGTAYGLTMVDANRLAHDARQRFNYRLQSTRYDLEQSYRKLDAMLDDNSNYDTAVNNGIYASVASE